MLFTVDSHQEKFSSMQPRHFFIGYLRSGYEEKSEFHVTHNNYRLEQVRERPYRRFPLLGTSFLRRKKWAGVMVITPES